MPSAILLAISGLPAQEPVPDRTMRARLDSAYAVLDAKPFRVEWDMAGLGIPQAVLGTSLSFHAKVGAFATSISIGAGLAQILEGPATFPALNVRLYAPRRQGRFFIGIGSLNPFERGPRPRLVTRGAEGGFAHDIGEPGGMKLNYGLTGILASKKYADANLNHTTFTVFPHASIAYAF
jgi:hypothetical protein